MLTYDYAYAGYSNAYNDGFRIEISNDCGVTWDSLYGAYGQNLQTTSYSSSSWFPTCNSWQNDTLNLSSYGYNGDTVMLKFVAINNFGNNFFLDNIKINGSNILSIGSKDYGYNFMLYPNPNNGKFNIETNYTNAKIEIFDISGRKITSKILSQKITPIILENIAEGLYILQITINSETIEKTLIIQH